ncbi:hypothetical protein G6M87_08110 [Rhizobium rhizogenes]|uniref:hypothetical protein n=1 Tax=Rhizobium rhizogenes TaxID=359 RepID=UPI001B3C21B2|nr:hypothetical protein [Rhizobium rhizogenes]NTI21839.1 hypothetical protein [Rhizobium rhizogenes]QTG05439.1 hypothetical protein G6M87_08110 [Rhizobium rhizogenes]
MKPLAVAALISISAATAAATETAVAPGRIVDAAIGDWNKDGKPDLALLVAPAPDDQADSSIGIYIYLRDGEHSLLRLAAAAPNKVWGSTEPDGIFGQEPSMKALPNGSLAVTSQNDAIGRDRWEQTLTLALRNNAFVVAGYTYVYRDTLNPDGGYSCDYNVLTGKATKGGKDLKTEGKTVKIEDWEDDLGQKGCGVSQ